MRWSRIGTLLVLALVAACGDAAGDQAGGTGAGPDPEPVRPLAKADGWRQGLMDSLDGEHPYALVEVAFDRATADRAWAANVPSDLAEGTGAPAEPGRYGNLDEVDFDTQAVVVWSSGQSGSCPGWLADVDTDGEGTVSVTTGQTPADACTDDYNAYRMVLAVDLDRLPDPTWLPVTDVVVDGRTVGAVSLVRAYPDA